MKTLNDRLSFVFGLPGLYAVAAIVEARLGNLDESRSNIKKLCNFGEERVYSGNQQRVSCEHLNGRCGYLYGLLFVNEELGEGTISKDFIKKVKDPDLRHLLEKLVKPTVDALMTYKHPSGNYRACLEPSNFNRDILVHWCHGSPGMIYLFTLAYKMFGDEKYLAETVGCSDVTWRRGLLRKGFTICHGIPDNAYCFVPVWHASGDKKHLYRAYKAYTCDFEKHGCIGEEADHAPMSLFCGLGGTICFLVDMLEPGTAKFPAFEVQNSVNTKPINT